MSGVCAGVLLGWEGISSAQVPVDAVYEDVRDTVNEMLEREVARALARQMTCHSSRGILVHYTETLDDVHYQRFESLGDSFRRESARLLGAYAYSLVLDPHAALMDLVPFSWDGGYDVPDLALAPEAEAKLRARRSAWERPRLSCLDQLQVHELSPSRYKRRLAPNPPAAKVALDACRTGSVPEAPDQALACELGLAVEAAAGNRLAEARRRLVSASLLPIAWQVADGDGDGEAKELWGFLSGLALAELDGTPVALGTELRALTVPITGADLQRTLPKILQDGRWSLPQREIVSAAAMALQPQALTVRIEGATFSGEQCAGAAVGSSSAEEFLDLLARSAGATQSSHVHVNALADDGALVVTILDGPAGASGPGLLQLEALWKGLRLAHELRTALPIATTAEGHLADAEDLARLLNAVLEVRRATQAWAEADQRQVSATSWLQPLVRTLRRTEELHCQEGAEGRSCALVAQVLPLTEEETFWDVFEAAASGDGAQAALRGLDGVFAAAQAWLEVPDPAMERLQALSTATLAYALGEQESGKVSVATREAFKTAAFDWLTSMGSGRGYSASGKFLTGHWLTLSSGASWSNGYVNRGSDGARLHVSADALMLQAAPVRGRNAYFVVSFSALNLLGPVTEIALRDADEKYDNESAVWVNFVQPRLDFSFGVPSFSRRLLIYTGTSLRPVAAFPAKSSTDPSAPDLVYGGPFGGFDAAERADDEAARFLRRLEFGIGVRFFPL